MRAWGQVEGALLDLFQKLLDADPTSSRTVFTALGAPRVIRETLLSLGEQRLETKDFGTLSKLMDSLKGAATKRNRLVHGNWLIHVKIHADNSRTSTWQRYYDPLNPALLKQMSGKKRNQKVVDAHIFPLKKIEELTGHAKSLANAIRAFAVKVSLKAVEHAQPVEHF